MCIFLLGEINGHLVADSGYACKPYCLTPYLNPREPQEEGFNKAHIGTRVVVEQLNGVVKRRFPCLSYGIRIVNLRHVCLIITSCCVLHNIGLERGDIMEIERVNNNEDLPQVPYDGPQDGKAYRDYIAMTYFA